MDPTQNAEPGYVAGAFIDTDGQRTEWVGSEPFITHPELDRSKREVEKSRVLVVEDEHLVALDIQLRLEKLGHTAEVAHSGEEALERAAQGPFDLVLMDIKLKGEIDGIETARKLRSSYDIPLIYLTAYADNHTLDRARVTEPYGYVLKPFQERELRAAIEMAIQRHGSDRQRWEQQQFQRFLADASARLAMTLDYRAVALGAADLLVPRYADWCTIHLRETAELSPGFRYTRPNGETEGSASVEAEGGHLIATVEHSSSSEILTQIPDTGALVDALGGRHISMLRELGARSLICVPLPARDQVLGALAIVSGRLRPRYTMKDLIFIEDFGRRLGMALDNALLYRAAERAIRMRDDVLAIVSHDLRTPLGTILMEAEAMSERSDVARSASGIMRAAHRMQRLIGDLLDASSINAGSVTLELDAHDAAQIAREALEMFRSHAEAQSIDLVEDIAVAGTNVYCDRERVIQVLSNLLGNALKFTPRGGRVALRIVRTGERLRFEVEDNGRGIDAAHVPHLFDRFWRGQHKGDGAGLGLFISRGIMAAHGSTLHVDTTVGVGSRFFFELPEAPA